MNKENVETIYRGSCPAGNAVPYPLRAGEGVYFEQFEIDFAEGLDPAAFTRAWQDLVDRNPVLRTSFVWEGLEEPAQVVHKRVSLPVLSPGLGVASPRRSRRRGSVSTGPGSGGGCSTSGPRR